MTVSPIHLRALILLRDYRSLTLSQLHGHGIPEDVCDELFRRKLLRLVRGHDEPVLELTDAGKREAPCVKPDAAKRSGVIEPLTCVGERRQGTKYVTCGRPAFARGVTGKPLCGRCEYAEKRGAEP